MKIWVVNSEEPIPQLKGRLMRGGTLADCFSDDGENDVTWWCSTFLHYEKRFYAAESVSEDIKDNLHIKMLHTKKAYRKNVSFARIRYCRLLAKALRKAIQAAETPDVIFCAWPNIEPAYECVRYGKKKGVPVVIDIRDFWPDVFTASFHGFMKYAAETAVEVLYGKKTRYVMQNADKVIGVVPDAMKLAEKYGRSISPRDHTVYLSFKQNKISDEELKKAYTFWGNLGITAGDFIAAYVGSLTDTCLSALIIEAAKKNSDAAVKFILCGSGPNLERCAEAAKDRGNILFPGYMNLPQMYALCSMAKVGLLPYRNSASFVNSVPSKFSEYLSYGLPVLTTLKGLSKTIVESENCGAFFSSADELNELISRYKTDEALRDIQSKNAKNLFEREFNAENTYKKLPEEMKETVNKKRNERKKDNAV